MSHDLSNDIIISGHGHSSPQSDTPSMNFDASFRPTATLYAIDLRSAKFYAKFVLSGTLLLKNLFAKFGLGYLNLNNQSKKYCMEVCSPITFSNCMWNHFVTSLHIVESNCELNCTALLADCYICLHHFAIVFFISFSWLF